MASLAVAVAAAVLFGWSHSENLVRVQSAASAPSKPSVAVLVDDAALTAALVREGKFQVVERAQLDKVFAELKLNRGEEFNSVTAQRVGLLLGAEYLLLGGRQAFGSEVQLNARLIRTETGEIVAAEEGNPPELAKKLAERVGK